MLTSLLTIAWRSAATAVERMRRTWNCGPGASQIYPFELIRGHLSACAALKRENCKTNWNVLRMLCAKSQWPKLYNGLQCIFVISCFEDQACKHNNTQMFCGVFCFFLIIIMKLVSQSQDTRRDRKQKWSLMNTHLATVGGKGKFYAVSPGQSHKRDSS